MIQINEWSRPAFKIKGIKAIVMHWVGGPGQTAQSVYNYFNDAVNHQRYGSAHYAIGVKGDVLQCIPDDEVAYHVGHANQKDPASGQFYTDKARELFGIAGCNPKTRGPNDWCLGIELCHPEMREGAFSADTIQAAIKLAADLCAQYKLDPQKHILRHHDVVGWKDCPRYWVKYSAFFDAFKIDVLNRMIGNLEDLR